MANSIMTATTLLKPNQNYIFSMKQKLEIEARIPKILELIKDVGHFEANTKTNLASQIGIYGSLLEHIRKEIEKAEVNFEEKNKYSDFFWRDWGKGKYNRRIIIGHKSSKLFNDINNGASVFYELVPDYKNQTIVKKLIDN